MANEVRVVDDGWCFVCGKKNPIGMKLDFIEEGEEYVAYFAAPKELQGFATIVHGGITTTLLDEVMARCCHAHCLKTVTGEITVRFKKPAKIGEMLRYAAKIEADTGRVVNTSGKVTDADGNVIAEATAKMVKIGEWVCEV